MLHTCVAVALTRNVAHKALLTFRCWNRARNKTYEQALGIGEELGDRAGQATTLKGLSLCNESLGQYAKAMELYEQSLAIAKEVGDRVGLCAAYNNLGLALAKSGDGTAAARALARGLV